MIIPEGYAQITHLYVGPSVPTGAANEYGIQVGDGSSADALADAFHTLWADRIMPALVETVTLQSTICKLGPNDTGAQAEFTNPEPGVSGTDGDSPNVAYLITKNTALGGRRGKGRLYLPGVNEVNIDEQGIMDIPKFTELSDDFQNFFEDVDGSPHNLVLLHSVTRVPVDVVDGRVVYGDAPGAVPAPTPITSFSVSSKVATQRRRIRR